MGFYWELFGDCTEMGIGGYEVGYWDAEEHVVVFVVFEGDAVAHEE